MDQITMLSKEADLAYYEEVKDIYLHPNLFSIENGLLSKGRVVHGIFLQHTDGKWLSYIGENNIPIYRFLSGLVFIFLLDVKKE